MGSRSRRTRETSDNGSPESRSPDIGGAVSGLVGRGMGWMRDRLSGGHDDKDVHGPSSEPTKPSADLSAYASVIELLQQAGVGVYELQSKANDLGLTVFAAAYGSGPSEELPDQGGLPAADLGSSGNTASRAYALDYDQASAYIDPLAPAEMAAGGEDSASIAKTFDGHWKDLFAQEFSGLNLQQVRGAIGIAETLGYDGAVDAIRARMYRVNQHAVIRTLNVEDSARYQPGAGNTYCNIYAYDVVKALGGYIPRVWWYDRPLTRIQGGSTVMPGEERDAMRANGEDVTDVVVPVYGETVYEMNANGLVGWMEGFGGDFGWKKGSAEQAQEAANGGQLAVMLGAGIGQSGHISVVTAEGFGHSAERDDNGDLETPLQSQAGAGNENVGTLGDQWWEDGRHRDSSAWIMTGQPTSSLVPKELMGR